MKDNMHHMGLLLSQCAKTDNIHDCISIFEEALNKLFSPFTFNFHSDKDSSDKTFPIKTNHCLYGFMNMIGNRNDLSKSTEDFLQLTFLIFQPFLENAEKKQKLLNEIQTLKNSLEQAKLEFRNQEEHFSTLSENITDILIRIDANYRIQYVNKAIETLTVLKKSEIPGTDIRQLVFQNERKQKWIDLLEKVFQFGETQKDYFLANGPQGQRILDVHLIPEFDQNKKLISVLCFARDITDLKEKESELELAKKKAEESDFLKSAFLANMSHEIRTPLNGILGFSQLLKEDDLSLDKRRLYSEIINNNGKQLLTIISDIIDISKIESGQLTIESNSVNLAEMFNLLCTQFKHSLRLQHKSDILLSIKNYPEELNLQLITDEIRLKQILQNMLSNAIKFTHQGHIQFGCRLTGDWVEFYVTDTGIGIAEEFKSIIFNRFRQVNEGFTREYGGTGLGLAIAKNLVELMGGKIWLTTELNKGTTFYFTIPLLVESEPIILPTVHPLETKFLPLTGKRILVVEDDEYNYNYVEAIYDKTGAQLIHVSNGLEAVDVCKNINPDLILMDIQLPIINGFEAITSILKILPKMKIFVLTANVLNNERKKCLELGCKEYLSKPVSRETLLNATAKWLNLEMLKF